MADLVVSPTRAEWMCGFAVGIRHTELQILRDGICIRKPCNALTAVCDWCQVDDARKAVQVRNLQVANGFQTTWTLWEEIRATGPDNLENVHVIAKLIEAPRTVDLARQISQSSNSQSQMRDWDFLFELPLQKRLQDEFERLGVFCELKRGEQRYIRRQTGSKTNIQNAAQATWAILGYPGGTRHVETDSSIRFP